MFKQLYNKILNCKCILSSVLKTENWPAPSKDLMPLGHAPEFCSTRVSNLWHTSDK